MARYPTKPVDKASTSKGGVAAVDRSLILLGTFGKNDRSLSLQELADRTGMVKSTVLRLLASLLHAQLIQKLHEGRYSLGPAVAKLFSVYTTAFGLDDLLIPILRELVQATQESASFHVRQGAHRVVLSRINSPQALSDQIRAGDIIPLNRGTGGRVLMAFSGAKGKLFDQIRLEKVIALVGDRVPELAGISAPVFDASGQLLGAITLTLPKERFVDSHVLTVKAAAASLTQKLGGLF
jgi:DNA-binding IclR family transcriptional regulator